MENKPVKKIFSIIIACVLLTSFCVGLELYTENIVPPVTGNTNIDDLEDMFDDNESETEDGNENNQTQQPSVEVPVYSNGFKCLEDAMEFINSCKGIKVVLNMTATADILGLGKATQTANETITLSGDYYLKETHTSCTSSLGKTYYRYFYSNDNGQNIEYKKTSSYDKDKIPNWDYLIQQDTVSKEEVYKYDNLAYDVFCITANRDNSTLVKFDRTTNQKYYIISFVYDVSKIPQKFIDNALREGALNSIMYKSMKLTYYIEKETLYLRKIEREESYTIDATVKLDVDAYQEIIITTIDKELTPSKPEYCNI